MAFLEGKCIAMEDLLRNFPSLVIGIGDLDSQAIFCFKAAFSFRLSVVCMFFLSRQNKSRKFCIELTVTMLTNYI